jgi:hypothetical protein
MERSIFDLAVREESRGKEEHSWDNEAITGRGFSDLGRAKKMRTGRKSTPPLLFLLWHGTAFTSS